MRPVALACLGLLGLAGTALLAPTSRAQQPAPAPAAAPAPASPAEAGRAGGKPADRTPAEPGRGADAAPPRGDGKAAGQRVRRRTSYAACNRASHRRNLHGGARRRFLTRCRLGYERIQPPAGQPARGRP
ncbi:hypothetical protein [Methylobacterium oryzihabitans]|uniref:Serine/threonine protein kinase n=1 Tax=Methylobacterium oryzihabitans TaxID=2499852 RepID=A0A437PHC0_9HYPH|nr:hypothetical protein [Methylobacterium oryzihabitans]RVU21671.1 hypothetical protein EOE48_01065 [Methylobacterium oryzihabitans]